ncbi:MAG TPA: ABC transporter C-terminal domain-containing protein [Solirubrobacterales bacterium]|nr:ABC transporter C-terminal domain-containing protein [Solirubrobacterales bacterium]
MAAAHDAKPPRPEDGRRRTKAAQRAARKSTRLAEKIEQAEAELHAVEEELSDPAAWSSPGRAERANERHAAAKQAVAELYEQWEEAEGEVSTAGN